MKKKANNKKRKPHKKHKPHERNPFTLLRRDARAAMVFSQLNEMTKRGISLYAISKVTKYGWDTLKSWQTRERVPALDAVKDLKKAKKILWKRKA